MIDAHDNECRRLAEDIARLRVAVRGPARRAPDPGSARGDAASGEPDTGEADATEEPDATLLAPAEASEPADEGPAEPPPFVRRDELLQAIGEETRSVALFTERRDLNGWLTTGRHPARPPGAPHLVPLSPVAQRGRADFPGHRGGTGTPALRLRVGRAGFGRWYSAATCITPWHRDRSTISTDG